MAFPGPTTVSHQPGYLTRNSRFIALALRSQPATWASPESACTMRTTLSLAGESLPYSSYSTTTGPIDLPDSSLNGLSAVASVIDLPSVQPTERGESGRSRSFPFRRADGEAETGVELV